ncbi:hypothetical protein FSP39_017489 [Pinctada imbricata]|uniref:Sulfhydryl light chain n=1 Tax=Pinctada imbricata TaxID=66713 RepID=A0AA88XJC6_PINIB|nr:hypothetical protein FSP39_017489 [Pinctada imbricata]
MSVTIVPLRILTIGVLLVAAFTLAHISLAFRSEEEKKKPLSGWRKSMVAPMAFLGRSIGRAAGFHIVKVVGNPRPSSEVPVVVVAPHSSYFDAFSFFFCASIPSTLSREENSGIPLIGSLIEFTQPVLVKREDPNSRQNTIKEIQRRAQSGGIWPQIIIFPEGTCTNRQCLINFKPGAFYPGVPVQPVCIRYLNKLDTITWTWEGPGAFKVLWFTLCQFNNKIEIEFLPVYSPSEEEIKDPKLFANNVRLKMAECLRIPTTDHTFDDCRLMQKAAKLKLPKSAGLVEFQKLHNKLSVKFDDMNVLLDKYGAIAKNKEGNITIEEFAKYLHLPISDTLQEVFDLYDRDGSGTIDFREYVIGLSIISTPVNTEETIKLAFELFDNGNKGHITQEELCEILYNAFNMDGLDAENLFKEVDTDQDGKISFDEFQDYALQKPEYAKLFMTYQAKKNEEKTGNGHPKTE